MSHGVTMQTDKQTLVEMLTRAGVEFTIKPDMHSEAFAGRTHPTAAEYIEIDTDGPNNHGYANFIACLFFDEEGKLVATGVWE